MLHVRQLWVRPTATHTSWLKQLTRSHLQDACRALHAASRVITLSQLSQQQALSSHSAALSTPVRHPITAPHRYLSTSNRKQQSPKRQQKHGAVNEASSASLPDASAHHFRVGIFGRPNVGKSTLFNRLVGQRVAITDSTPGVTRDPLHHTATLSSLQFTVIDTAGLEPVQTFLSQPPSPSQLINKQNPSTLLQHSIQEQTRRTVRHCHVALFLVDARQPLSDEDIQWARMVREEHYTLVSGEDGRMVKRMMPVVLVANKVEEGVERERLPGLDSVYQLGLGEPIEMSAEHGEGLAMLHNVLDKHMQTLATQRQEATNAELADNNTTSDTDADSATKPIIHMAIVGRPNTGKSTLLNALLNDQRALTGPQPGITRDPIRSLLPPHSHPLYRFHVVDTAGIRGGVIRREGETRVDAEAMRLSMRAIDRANAVVLVLDVSGATQLGGGGAGKAGQAGKRWKGKEEEEEALLLSKVSGMLSQQDLSIAKRVTDEGRGLVVALNKVDLLAKDDKQDVLRGLRLLLDRTLPQVKDVPLIPLSATTTQHLPTLLPAIVWLYDRWTKTIPTTRLTNWLLQLQQFRPHPSYKGRRIRLKFMRQVAVRPPTFSVWVGGGGGKAGGGGGGGGVEGVSEEWMRMMRGMLCQEFGLEGVNVRVKVRRGEVKDREERRQDARARDEKEERERVRRSTIEVKDDGEAQAVDEDDMVDGEEGEEDESADDVDVHEYRMRAADEEYDEDEEQETEHEEVEDEMNEEHEEEWVEEEGMEVDEDDVDEVAERSLQSSHDRRPRFIPFDQDPDRIAAVAAATSQPSFASSSASTSTLPAVPGFMSPPPLATPIPNTLGYPTHYPRSRSSHLSFLPLPSTLTRSTSLPWTERRLLQQKRTRQRSTAIREKNEQAQFVSVGAWRNWKVGVEERRQRYLRRERKVVAGRERKAARMGKGKGREQEVRVVGVEEQDEEVEGRRSAKGARRGQRSGTRSRVQHRQFAGRARG